MQRRAFLTGLLPLIAACDIVDKRENKDDDNDGTAPTPVPEPPRVNEFEFRVTGDMRRVMITISSTTEGITKVITDLPWFTTIRSTRESMFLSISAEAEQDVGNLGTIVVQIFVNGLLFREASASGFDPAAAVSGSWTA